MAKCGSCHVLARAQTKGTTGPNLDEAFQQALKDGMKRSGFTGAIHGQILHPNLNGVMPAKLVTGDEAYDVAAYVAQSVAAGGKDTGLLATAVKQAGGGKPAVEKNGTLQIDADPTGQLAFVTDTAHGHAGDRSRSRWATSRARRTTSSSTARARARSSRTAASRSSAPTSRPAATRSTARCPGHRQAGMQGKLTVK